MLHTLHTTAIAIGGRLVHLTLTRWVESTGQPISTDATFVARLLTSCIQPKPNNSVKLRHTGFFYCYYYYDCDRVVHRTPLCLTDWNAIASTAPKRHH